MFPCILSFILLFSVAANAHIGSPDVFYEGEIGPYPAHVTIRMPTVVPGRAQILVRTDTNAPIEVSFRPLFVNSAITNAPPPDIGQAVPGATNLYSGDLWLMTFGGYSIEVKLHGPAGEGAVEIPVNSVALRQKPMPRAMGVILSVLGIVLVLGGAAIVKGAARDSTLAPGSQPTERDWRKGWIAGTICLSIVIFAVWFGNRWWKHDEREFRGKLRETRAPELKPDLQVKGAQRILLLTIGRTGMDWSGWLNLLPDHDKLLHLFLIRHDSRDAFAHLHPIRKGGAAFEIAVPPLPPGSYDIYCDMTLDSGLSTTSTNSIQLPAIVTENASAQQTVKSPYADPDDSWAGSTNATLPPMGTATNNVFQLPDGSRMIWKAHGPLRAQADAGLEFEVLDASGNPAQLEPYMGMLSHAAVLRSDGGVFAHLHPSGNYSMAAQMFYENKLSAELAACASPGTKLPAAAVEHAAVHEHRVLATGTSTISLPYEFPTGGNYRVWVQVKIGGRVQTAVFDALVSS